MSPYPPWTQPTPPTSSSLPHPPTPSAATLPPPKASSAPGSVGVPSSWSTTKTKSPPFPPPFHPLRTGPTCLPLQNARVLWPASAGLVPPSPAIAPADAMASGHAWPEVGPCLWGVACPSSWPSPFGSRVAAARRPVRGPARRPARDLGRARDARRSRGTKWGP